MVDNASPTLKKVDVAARKLGKSSKVVDLNAKRAQKGLFGFGSAAKGAGISSAAAIGPVVGLGAAINAALGPIALFTGGAALLGAAIKGIADQDKAAASLRTLGVNTDELVPKLAEVSAELGHQASQTELTVAAYDVASAGFTNAADAAMVLKASSLAASAGMADLATTGDAVTTVLNAWKMSASDAETVADKMQQTVADGKITIAAYAANIGKVATVASMVGVPLDEVNAAIALSTKNGVKADVAFTGMKTALLRLTGEAGGKKLKNLGIDISAATLASEGLAANLEKLAGLDIKALEQIFGQEAIQTMGPVLANLKEYNQILEKQEQSAGAAREAQQKTADTIGGAWKELTTVFENAFTKQNELTELIKVTIQATTGGLKLIGFLIGPLIEDINKLIKLIVRIGEEVVKIQRVAGDWLGNLFGKPKEKTAPEVAAEGMKKIAENAEGAANNITKTNRKLKDTSGLMTNVKDNASDAQVVFDEIGKTIGSGMTSALKGAIQGTKTFGQVASNVLSKVTNLLMDYMIQASLASAFGGDFGKWLGFRKAGGPVTQGKPYVVGERGPELFIPGSSGKIISNSSMSKAGGSTVTVNVDASGSAVEGDSTQAGQLGEALALAIQTELVKQRRPGGLLA
jgi:TP901 family phage tail tape measure protein